MINNRQQMHKTAPPKRRRKPAPPLAAKSRPGPKSNKQSQIIAMMRQPMGATLDEMSDAIGWKVSAITRVVQSLLFCTRAGVRRISSEKRPDGATVYRAA